MTTLPIPSATPTVRTADVLSEFMLTCRDSTDSGARPWIAQAHGIDSTAPDPASGYTFILQPLGQVVTQPIGLAGTRRASRIQTRIDAGLSTRSRTIFQLFLPVRVDFDNGHSLEKALEITNTGSWTPYLLEFDVPDGVVSCTITLRTLDGGVPCPFNNFQIVVLSQQDRTAYLSQKYDQVCWLCAHNAFSNNEDGWVVDFQQFMNVTHQLQYGVRALMLDISLYENDIYLLHGDSTKSALARPGWKFRRLQETLTEVNDFLDANPDEVVTIFLESNVKNSQQGYQLTLDAFSNAGTTQSNLLQKVFYFDRPNPNRAGQTWTCATQGAPSLEWMVSANLRCVVFTDYRGPNDQYSAQPTSPSRLPNVWHFVRESVYGNRGLDPANWTDQRDESKDSEKQNPNRKLALLNHFPDFVLPRVDDIPPYVKRYEFNDAQQLQRHVDAWLTTYQKLPNFLAVDYVTLGEDGGPLTVVAETNRRWVALADKDLLKSGNFAQIGKPRAQLRSDFVALHKTTGITVNLYNLSDYDFDVVGHAREGQIFEALPKQSPGRLATPVRLANAAGSIACAGAFSSTGNRAFWLLSNPGTSKLLFVAFALPSFPEMGRSNYANAFWITPTYAAASFVSNGSGADALDALFDQLFSPTSNPSDPTPWSNNPDLRVRAVAQITQFGSLSGIDDPYDMFVVLTSY